jgi:hypothetical protein
MARAKTDMYRKTNALEAEVAQTQQVDAPTWSNHSQAIA